MSHGWQRPGYDPVTLFRGPLGAGMGGVVCEQRVKDLGLGLIIGMAGMLTEVEWGKLTGVSSCGIQPCLWQDYVYGLLRLWDYAGCHISIDMGH